MQLALTTSNWVRVEGGGLLGQLVGDRLGADRGEWRAGDGRRGQRQGGAHTGRKDMVLLSWDASGRVHKTRTLATCSNVTRRFTAHIGRLRLSHAVTLALTLSSCLPPAKLNFTPAGRHSAERAFTYTESSPIAAAVQVLRRVDKKLTALR